MKLVIEDESGTRSVLPFAADEITVGRGPSGVTFRLAARNVSRRHARFLRAGGGVTVEDLGSLTGTRVNGDPIEGRRRLREGDVVQIGDYDIAVSPEEARVAPGAPPLPAGPRTPAPRSAGARAPEPTVALAPREMAALASGRPAPRHASGRAVRAVALAGVGALALGTALGFAVGWLLLR